MPSRRVGRVGARVAAGAAIVVVALGLSSCKRADEQSPLTNSTTLTVYLSLPLQGPEGPESEAIANGAKLALEEAGGRVNGFTVKPVVLDDSTPKANGWDGEQAAGNARKALNDKTTIAFIGDVDSGATAITLPLLNAAGILQISPVSTYAGLTKTDDADKGEPEKYYPGRHPTFGRVVPADDLQAAAQLDLLQRGRCSSVEILDDRDFYGRGIASAVQREATAAGLKVAGSESLREESDPRGQVARIVKSRADCLEMGATPADWVAKLLDAVHAAAPGLQLFGPAALARPDFLGQLDAGTQARLSLTEPAPVPQTYSPAAKDVVTAYHHAFGIAARPEALFGYEAMKVVLLAIRGAGGGGGNRAKVASAFFQIRDRDSVLGRYSFDKAGDTSLNRYAEEGVRDGRAQFRRVETAVAAPAPATPADGG